MKMGYSIFKDSEGKILEVTKNSKKHNTTVIRHNGCIEIHNGPRMDKSEQNKEWDKNRPDTRFQVEHLRIWKENKLNRRTRRYNRKYTNNLGSHMGESRNSRADKMSGSIFKQRGPTKTFIKHFYGRKRRMFLKNERNWEKI